MNKQLQSAKYIMALLFVLFMGIRTGWAYNFAYSYNGKKLYYDITDPVNRYVQVVAPGDFEWNGYTKPTGNLAIPQTVRYNNSTYTVTSIGNYAFYYCTDLNMVTISNSVTSIGNSVFHGCTGLTSIDFPNSVTSIGNNAFLGCIGLTSIEIPNFVTNLERGVFSGCTGLISIEIPNSVISIGASAFWGCFGLSSVTIPNSVISIGEDAFSDCTGLTSVEIPNSVTFIGDLAFYGCTGLTSIDIPNSVTFIGNSAFSWCTGLTSIEIPNSVTSIGSAAFSCCTGLTQMIVSSANPNYDSRDNCNAIIETASNTLVAGCMNTIIPNSVASIGGSAFSGCSGLTLIEIPNSITSIGDLAFSGCTNLISIEIPNSVTFIGIWAFSGCTGLTSIEIPNSVISIGDYAFSGCTSLISIEIPNSVTTIGNYAFYNSSSLTEIMMLGTNVSTLENSFFVFDNTNDCPIYVPYESLNAYKTATNWSSYEERIFPMAYISVSGYGEGEGKWYFIASPLTEDIAPTAVNNMITETDYDLYYFDQSEDLEWRNYKVDNFNLVNGQGYLYANDEEVNVIFKGEFNEDETMEVELVYDANAEFAGWNLVGNPFPVSTFANRSYYVMNEDGTAIEPVAVSMETTIPACTGIMVKADNIDETVVFSKATPETATCQGVLQIALAQNNTRDLAIRDKVIVSFNEGDELGKFVFNEGNAKLYIPHHGEDYAIAYAEKMGEMPLNFKAAKNGEYTLTVNPEGVEMEYLHLIDNMAGADIDLLQTSDYTFNAKTTDYVSRFRLAFSVCGNADGNNEGDNAFAFIRNGVIAFTNAEAGATLQIVDVTGRIVVSSDVAHNVSTSGIPAGVYVLRLINGNDVKMQKMVID